MRTQNFDALQAALSDEYIAEQQHYDAKNSSWRSGKQATIDAHWNGQQLLIDALNAGIDSMQSGISGLIQGTTSLMTAIQNIGKAILKTIADFIASWIAAMVKKPYSAK